LKNAEDKFDYEKALKTKSDDTFLNLQSLLYVSSKQITKLLFYTPVTPHHIIFVSMLFGVISAFLIIQSDIVLVICGAVLLFYKNVLDKVDGSLARAKGLDSRRGRFYDSLADFIVTLALFSAISCSLYMKYNNPIVFITGFAAMICSMLQCSFFIFYQVSFIKISGKETVNRLVETVREEDKASADKWTLFLQRLFQLIYGWQDFLIYKLDLHMKMLFQKRKSQITHQSSGHAINNSRFEELWYKNKLFLTFSSILSIGTHMLLIAVFSLFRSLELYFFVNLILLNLLLICFIAFKYVSVLTMNFELSEKSD
jgi:phosphatidylglycerophosphate synthase